MTIRTWGNALRLLGCGLVAGALGCIPAPIPPLGLPLHRCMSEGLRYDTPPDANSVRRQRVQLGCDVEAFPILTSAEYWLPIYDLQTKAGIQAYRARLNTRRAAHYGPAVEEIVKICKVHKDAESLQAALDLKHTEVLHARWSQDDRIPVKILSPEEDPAVGAPETGQPEQPPAQPEQPPAQPEQPPAQPEQPPAQPEQPPAQPEQPPAQPEQPPAQPEQPPAQPEKPDELPPVEQPPEQPPAQPEQPPEQPPTQPEQPPTQPEQPPAQPEQPPPSETLPPVDEPPATPPSEGDGLPPPSEGDLPPPDDLPPPPSEPPPSEPPPSEPPPSEPPPGDGGGK